MAEEQQMDESAAFGHDLRGYAGRSMPCGWCTRMGPSPQTGARECRWCRMCETCTTLSAPRKVCHASGILERGEQPPSQVRWAIGRWVMTFQRPAEEGQGFLMCTTQDTSAGGATPEPLEAWRAVYGASPSPELKIGNRHARHIATLPLPTQHVPLSDLLAELVLFLNACGVSHEVPLCVDDGFVPLPHAYLGGVTASPVVSCAMSASANFALTMHADGTAHLTETRGEKKGTLVWTRLPRRGEQSARHSQVASQHVDMSVCARFVAVGGPAAPTLLLTALTGEVVRELRGSGFSSNALCLSFSPCGRYILVVDPTHAAEIYGSKDGRRVFTVPSSMLMPYTAGLWCCCFSASSGFIAMSAEEGGRHGVVVVGQWRKNAPSATMLASDTQKTRAVAVRFDSSDSQLMCAALDGTITLWNTTKGETFGTVLRTITHSFPAGVELCAAAFLGDERIATIDTSANRWYWDRRGLQTIVHGPNGARAVCGDFSLRGRVCYGTDRGEVQVCGAPMLCGDPDPTHPHNTIRTRAVQRHAGQGALLTFLLWQEKLRARAAEVLPTGVTILRQLPDDSLRRVASFIPSPATGDEMEGSAEPCAVM